MEGEVMAEEKQKKFDPFRRQDKTVAAQTEDGKTMAMEEQLAWTEARQDPDVVKQVQAYKVELAKIIRDWGQKHGIEDLSLQHIMTMAKNPEAKVFYFWNPDKQVWFRYRNGDEVPRWLVNLPNRNNFKYPDGSALTSEMKAKFRGRGNENKEKVTSLD
jgi:hypothetical protein